MARKKIFISYRRDTNLKDAQLLEAKLSKYFDVFLDVNGLDGGDNWLLELSKHLDQSAAMVVLICRGWAEMLDISGNLRLGKPGDIVRFEISRALTRQIPILPVVVDGAKMPDAEHWPQELVPLTFAQGISLRKESFAEDAEKIARRLRQLTARASRFVGLASAAAVSAIALLVGLALGLELRPEIAWFYASFNGDWGGNDLAWTKGSIPQYEVGDFSLCNENAIGYIAICWDNRPLGYPPGVPNNSADSSPVRWCTYKTNAVKLDSPQSENPKGRVFICARGLPKRSIWSAIGF